MHATGESQSKEADPVIPKTPNGYEIESITTVCSRWHNPGAIQCGEDGWFRIVTAGSVTCIHVSHVVEIRYRKAS